MMDKSNYTFLRNTLGKSLLIGWNIQNYSIYKVAFEIYEVAFERFPLDSFLQIDEHTLEFYYGSLIHASSRAVVVYFDNFMHS
jgi:hypothetical protein